MLQGIGNERFLLMKVTILNNFLNVDAKENRRGRKVANLRQKCCGEMLKLLWRLTCREQSKVVEAKMMMRSEPGLLDKQGSPATGPRWQG